MKRILIIEDNADVRENTAEILELSNYEVITAENGKEGVKLASEALPDLIVCDVMMPELDGFGVLRILTQNPVTAQIPFIFLTAKTEKIDFRKGMSLGADDYITKPFDDVELLNAIEVRIKKHELFVKAQGPNGTGFVDPERGMEALMNLAKDREERSYRKKDFIFREGEYPKQVFFLNKGKVKTYKSNDDGKELIMSLYKEGDFLGFLPMLQSTTYPESAVALEDCIISIIPQKDFFELLHNNLSVASSFLQSLAKELSEKEEQLIELAYNSVRKRVADALVRLQTRYKEEGQDVFTISILRDDLASMVGTAKETVIRTLSDFKDEGIIDIKGSKITIVEEKKLENMLN
jgi:CRP/FNR family transcriptional regulator, polysaccharide utilization system transcription regulator